MDTEVGQAPGLARGEHAGLLVSAGMGQRAELHKTIWRLANEVRGSVDGWDFKSYVLGTPRGGPGSSG